MEGSVSWPDDADGDVFRRLEADGFDFSKSYAIDYNVDFETWPPAPAALEILRSQYNNVEVFEPDEDGDGYVLFQITGLVTYEGVTSVQRRTSSTMQPYGGICDSWGVLH
ncbi:hypothetical protein GCM10027432_09760 [Lysobacter fragariae]